MPVLPTTKEIEAEHRRLRAEYGTLFDDIGALLFRHDPIGINFDDNTDEYDLRSTYNSPALKNLSLVGRRPDRRARRISTMV